MNVWECGSVGVWGKPSAGIPGEGGSGAGHPAEGAVPEDAAVSHTPTPPHSHTGAVTAQALSWLDARESPPPPELRARMAEALEAAVSETVPGALAEGALSCLRAASEHPQERASALDLLAADALLTYALEAAAELGAETLGRMAESYGPDTLASLLPQEPEGEP